MKKLKLRAMAWAMLLTFLLSSSVGTAVEAAETVAVTAATVEAKNPMEVTKAELASGKVLYVTADMLDVDGNLVIADGSWEKIVIAKEVMAEKVTLRGVTATELVVESGTKCVVQVEKATVGTLTVAKPQLEHIGYTEICTMLDSGMDAVEVVKIYKNYLDTKARLESIPVTITTGADSTVQTLAVSGSSKLELGNGKVAEVKIESRTVDNHLRVSVAGYDGKVSVDQKKTEQGSFNIVNLEIKDSNLSELTISGGGTCTVAKQGDSKVGNVSVSGSTSVQLRVPAEKVSVDEKSEKVSLKLYSDVGELSAEGDDVKIAVSSSAKIDNQENVSSDVKVSVGIKSPGTSSSSSSSKPKPKPTATPKPEPMPDEDEPTVTPDPTPDVEEPTVTPDPTPGAGEDDGKDDPSDYPEITPGGDDPTESNTGGALKPGDGNEEEPTPTPTPTPGEDEKEEPTPTSTPMPTPTSTPAPTPTSTPMPTPTSTPAPTPTPTSTPTPTPGEEEEDTNVEYSPASWFEWEEDGDGVVISFFRGPYDEETGEKLDYDGVVVVPKTIEDMPVIGITDLRHESITELILPEGLLYIEDFAFQESMITSLTIPASVERLSEYALSYIECMEEIIVDEDNENYASVDGCLYDKEVTTLLHVPYAWYDTELVLPDTVESILFEGMDAGNSTIETLVLTDKVSDFIVDYVWTCENLQDVQVVDENPYFEDYGEYILTEDGTELIYVEPGVTEFEIPSTVTEFYLDPFVYSGCLPLEKLTVETGNKNYCVNAGVLFTKDMEELICYTSEVERTSFTVPETVTTIGYHAFAYSGLENIVLPEGLVTIGGSAFAYTPLTSISLPEGLIKIGSFAFDECEELVSAEIPSTVEGIGGGTFYGCTSLKELVLSSGVKRIPDNMCRDCISLETVEIPNTVTEIGKLAFYACESLKEVVIPDSVTTMGYDTFMDCSGLTKLTISKGLKAIPNAMCYRCPALKEIEIPDGVTRIGSAAFQDCTALERLIIPDSVEWVGSFISSSMKQTVTLVTTNEVIIEYAERYGYKVEQ